MYHPLMVEHSGVPVGTWFSHLSAPSLPSEIVPPARGRAKWLGCFLIVSTRFNPSPNKIKKDIESIV